MRVEPNKHQSYLEKTVEKPSLIQWVESRLEKAGKLGINIGLQEGLILKNLCSQPHVEKVVEIGTQYGCSASWMAMGLGDKGHIYTFEKDPDCLQNSQETFNHPDFMGLGCQVTLVSGDARETLNSIESQGPFDLIFIDANKAAYLDYLNWAKKNLKAGGSIVADNVYLFGSVFKDQCPQETPEKMWRVMKEVLESQLNDSQYHSALIPTEEGLLISTRQL